MKRGLGYEYVILPEDATPTGAIETLDDARVAARMFKKNAAKIDGVIVTLPNFGDEIAVVQTLDMAELDVPVLVHAFDDELDRLDFEHRRNAFCGKFSVYNSLYQYDIPSTNKTFHDVLGESLGKDRCFGADKAQVAAGPMTFFRFRQQALLIVQPYTLLRWRRDLFRRYWRRKSKSKKRKPRIALETIDLIREMVKENRLWGAERIRGQLLKLGIKVTKRTVQKYMPKVRQDSSQTWAICLKNHAGDIWACDFTVVHDLLFPPIYIFVVIELMTRRIVHTAVTRSPTDDWTAQQLREATPWSEAPKDLIRDRDSKYGQRFSAVAAGSGIEELRTPFQTPKANAHCERFIGTLKRECLDHMLILHRAQLHHVVTEFVGRYSHSRPHQGIGQRIPARFDEEHHPQSGRITSMPVLSGLHHSYIRVAI